ncbi:MAG: GtrA family protein [Candidatus Omnitrophica bacterium]|nr:GtrA family protein [Candidatus Omnitrophota bacterium]
MEKDRNHNEEFYRVARYLIVGGWNTLFGIGVYALLYALLHDRVHYLILMIPANILAVTNAYFCYKIFVFKSRGNYVREYLRYYAVYGGMIVFVFVLMYVLVSIFNLHPVLAQCVCSVVSICCSYISNKKLIFTGGSAFHIQKIVNDE